MAVMMKGTNAEYKEVHSGCRCCSPYSKKDIHHKIRQKQRTKISQMMKTKMYDI